MFLYIFIRFDIKLYRKLLGKTAGIRMGVKCSPPLYCISFSKENLCYPFLMKLGQYHRSIQFYVSLAG